MVQLLGHSLEPRPSVDDGSDVPDVPLFGGRRSTREFGLGYTAGIRSTPKERGRRGVSAAGATTGRERMEPGKGTKGEGMAPGNGRSSHSRCSLASGESAFSSLSLCQSNKRVTFNELTLLSK